ncbi:putative RIP metalloprotease RseP [Gleimia coleocanis DSM 15436]|uniref:Putative RIP metalloprotease RseP n=1 Tax=Gleimia coleocanis DSM 15436 TaxID=525245 RepID=C0W053_9ACTO|nr:M50 family metallopeptidase [Gleimia coleocanis]EEH63912.1 putative RIP metalloprotease RseP [Gleimia coleocanis DSM 15436]
MYVLGIFLMILAIVISVAIHELGHLLPAKKFGVYVPEYMIGFGPKLWSVKKGDTEYGVKAILLGGYVRLVGMFAPARPGTKTHTKGGQLTLAEEARQHSASEVPAGRENQVFYKLKTWHKLVVMFGGPLTNLVLSVVLLAVVIMGFGINQPVPTVSKPLMCLGTLETSCTASHPASPATAAGLQAGDRVVALAGKPVEKFADLGQILATLPVKDGVTQPVELKYIRAGKEQRTQITPVEYEGSLKLGIVGSIERVHGSFGDVLSQTGQGLQQTAGIVLVLPQQVWNTAVGLVSGAERQPDGVLSIVGVSRIAGEVTAADSPATLLDRFSALLGLWASLNLALFVFNMIPLPPLDGGHIAGAIYEGGRRAVFRLLGKPDPGPADTAKLVPLAQIMVGFFGIMTLILVFADLWNPIHLP